MTSPLGVELNVFRSSQLDLPEFSCTLSAARWKAILAATHWTLERPACWTRHECVQRYADVERAVEEVHAMRAAAADHYGFFEMDEDSHLLDDLDQLATLLNHCIDPGDLCWFISIVFIMDAPLTPSGRNHDLARWRC